jgi:hypothetical protein
MDSYFYRGFSLFARIAKGSWALHSFIVFDFEDEN